MSVPVQDESGDALGDMVVDECVIFDLDGTLCDVNHRLHYVLGEPPDWSAFHAACSKDALRTHIFKMVVAFQSLGYNIYFCTGRPELFRPATITWLSERTKLCDYKLMMRADGDFRKDYDVKFDMLRHIREVDMCTPILVVDDKLSVVRMFMAQRVPAVHVL